jgi:arylsulfatase
MQYVTDGRRKFVWLPRLEVEQFFDLEQDLGECINLIDDSDRQDEIAQWRGYLVHELARRECGWVRDGAVVAPPDQASGTPDEPLVSPYKDVRWMG